MQDLEQWVFLMGNFGFPVLITVYLLIRFQKKIEELTAVINTLTNSIDRINSKK